MSDLLRSIIDIRHGFRRPHEPVKTFKMNSRTYEKLLRVFNQSTFIDAGISIEIDPKLAKDEVVKVAKQPADPPPRGEG